MTTRTPERTVISNIDTIEAPTKITVSLVADDERFRAALTFQLVTAGFEVSAYSSAESFLEADRHKDRDCILADIFLPGMNGLQLLAKIKQSTRCAQMVFLTGCGDVSCGVEAMREGAVDYLEKPTEERRLLEAIMRAAELSRKKRTENSKLIELRRREMTLTPREREVFVLVTTGLLNKQVGATLGATERTIKTHRGRVMEKMNANSLAELVLMADLLQVHPVVQPNIGAEAPGTASALSTENGYPARSIALDARLSMPSQNPAVRHFGQKSLSSSAGPSATSSQRPPARERLIGGLTS